MLDVSVSFNSNSLTSSLVKNFVIMFLELTVNLVIFVNMINCKGSWLISRLLISGSILATLCNKPMYTFDYVSVLIFAVAKGYYN